MANKPGNRCCKSFLYILKNINSNKNNLSLDDLIIKTKEIIGLKHYSIKMQKSYINWLKQFHNFVNKDITDYAPKRETSIFYF